MRRLRRKSIEGIILGLGLLGLLTAAALFWPAAQTTPKSLPEAPSPRLPPEPAAPAARVAATQPTEPPRQSPHPYSAERSQLQEAGFLLHHIASALDALDLPRARELLGEHARKFPGSDPLEREGYELILLCLQTRDEAATDQAQKFLADHPESRLRKRLRQVCLDTVP